MELLQDVMQQNFIEYSSYVIKDRAIPDVRDGLKPVQRRILHTLYQMDDGKFHKVANVVGSCMKYHPHGDASIYSALVNIANKEFFIERQGNFGNIYTGDEAAAARYIECRLTPLAKEVIFNPKITDYLDSYDGRNKEPIYFPCKIPYLLMTGSEGIAVGMSTKILPHNFVELLNAQINTLKGEPVTIFPDFLQGGELDVSDYDQGNGKVRVRAVIEKRSNDTLVITEIPYGTTTESLISSIEEAAKKGKIKISKINDYTAEKVEISISLVRGTDIDPSLKALYAFTNCEVSISPSLLALDARNPQYMNVGAVLERNTKDLVYILKRELYYDLDQLQQKLHHKLLEQIFIENRIYKKIENCETYEQIQQTLLKSMKKYENQLKAEVSPADIEKLLQIRIKRISKFDINQSIKEIEALRAGIAEIENNLKEIRDYTINFLKSLIKKYGKQFPRRTLIKTFQNIDRSKIALKTIKVHYDEESGYLGKTVKEGSFCECNPYQKLVLINSKGILKVVNIPDKIFVEDSLVYFGIHDKDTIWTIIYKDIKDHYLKRFSVPKFQVEKEYQLLSEEKQNIVFLSTTETPTIEIKHATNGRTKTTSYPMEKEKKYPINSMTTKGLSLGLKRVKNISELQVEEELDSEE